MSLPWYKWWSSDWICCETRFEMNLAERGMLRDLLDLHYQEGSIPKNPRVLVGFLSVNPSEFQEAWKVVSKEFMDHPSDPDRLVNKRALQEIQSLKKRRQAQRNNGLKGGRPRKTHGLAKKNPRVSVGLANRKPSESESESDNPSLPLRGISPLEQVVLGEHGWVRLKPTENRKLEELLGPHLADYVTRFDLWVQESPDAKTSSGKRRNRNPYLTIRQWFNRDKSEGKLPKATNYGHSTDKATDALAEAARRRAARRADPNMAPQLRGNLPEVRRDDDPGEGGSVLRITGGSSDG